MRAFRILGWIVGGLLLVVVAAGAAVWLGGGRVALWAIEHPVSRMIGRQIRIGDASLKWGSPTVLVLEDVHVANASWSHDPEMFSARRLEIRVQASTLLSGPTRVPLIAVDGGRLLLETSPTEERNWDIALKSAAPQKRGQFPDLRHVDLANSELVYRNGVTGAEASVAVQKLAFDAPDPTAPVEIELAGEFQHQPIQLKTTVGPIAELRNPTKPYPIKFGGALADLRLEGEGTVAEPLDVAGVDMRLSFEGNTEPLWTVLALPLPQLPRARATGEVSGGNGHWQVKAFTLAAGHSDLEGGIEVDTTAKVPEVVANLTARTINVADFAGVVGATPKSNKASGTAAKKATSPGANAKDADRVLPATPIDVRKLPGVNARIAFDATHIEAAPGIPLDRISLGLQLKDGVLEIKPMRFHTADGDVDFSMQFTPFTRNTPPQLSADIDVRHVDLHKFFGAASMPQFMRATRGTAGGFIKIKTNGVSVREFLAHMNGDAGFFIGDGQLSALMEKLAPLDVLGALGVYVSGDKPVAINCGISRFSIKDGIATIATFLVDTPDTQIAGSGSINFADETLFLRLTPRNKHFAAVSLRTPVDIRATFAHPDIQIDKADIAARLGAAIGLAIVAPPAALLPLIDTGLGEQNACGKAYAKQTPPGTPPPVQGSGTQP